MVKVINNFEHSNKRWILDMQVIFYHEYRMTFYKYDVLHTFLWNVSFVNDENVK